MRQATGRARWLAVALAVLAWAPAPRGQVRTELPVATFRPIAELQAPAGATVTLIGGRPATTSDWPASFYSRHGGGRCTSTLVGPGTLLTAAHCVSGTSTAVVLYKNGRYTARCSYSADYDPATALGASADWALCRLDRRVDDPTLLYEQISTSPAAVVVGTQVLLTGFGCANINLTGGNDGIFRIAEGDVHAVPSANSHDIVVRSPTGGATICPGDSGSGVYRVSPDMKRRVIVAVNSRTLVQGKPPTQVVIGESLLSSLAVGPARAFVDAWIAQTGEVICGVTPAATQCRQTP